MPTYEYLCQDCDKSFEIRSSVSEYSKGLKAKCPACGSQRATRTFTTVTVLTGKAPKTSGARGPSSGSGGCCR